jgi:hypothetical protein
MSIMLRIWQRIVASWTHARAVSAKPTFPAEHTIFTRPADRHNDSESYSVLSGISVMRHFKMDSSINTRGSEEQSTGGPKAFVDRSYVATYFSGTC